MIKHLTASATVCIDTDADLDKAIRVADNAKTSRYAPCNTMETLLVSRDIAAAVLPPVASIYRGKGRGAARLRGHGRDACPRPFLDRWPAAARRRRCRARTSSVSIVLQVP